MLCTACHNGKKKHYYELNSKKFKMFISLIKLICIYSYSLIIYFFSFGQLGVNDDKGKIYIMSNYYFDPPNAKYTRVS